MADEGNQAPTATKSIGARLTSVFANNIEAREHRSTVIREQFALLEEHNIRKRLLKIYVELVQFRFNTVAVPLQNFETFLRSIDVVANWLIFRPELNRR